MGLEKTNKKMAPRIANNIEKRIVDLSLCHPDFGAKRLLPILNKENIDVSTSTVYRILKRHGQQNRLMRISKIEAQQQAAIPSQHIEIYKKYVDPGSILAEEPAPPVESVEEKRPLPRPRSNAIALTKSPKWSRSGIFILNTLLFTLVGYLGSQAAQNFQQIVLKSDIEAKIQIPQFVKTVEPEIKSPSLIDYHGIWERNLFNIPRGRDSQREKEIVLDNLALAQKELGLKLLGTVKADHDTLSLAIIHNRKTKEQKIFHEGDVDGNLLIKKILRNKVVIRTDNSDVLLTITPQDFRKNNNSAKRQKPIDNFDYPQEKAAASSISSSKIKHIRLNRNQIDSDLADLDALMQEVRIFPYKRNKKPSGFIISNIPGGSILRKLGLRSRDVIKEVNGQKFSVVLCRFDEILYFFLKSWGVIASNTSLLSVLITTLLRKILFTNKLPSSSPSR